jgi:hypothetical protein
MRDKAPLQPLIAAIEEVRERCYVCDRGPLDDMLLDLRRWARQLSGAASPQGQRDELEGQRFAPDGPLAGLEESEPVTVVERPNLLQAARR